MRVDVIADNPLEAVADALGLLPSPVVRVLFSVAIPHIVVPALQLGVLDAMAAGHETPDAIARATDCDVAGLRALLCALNGFGLIRHRRGRYTLRQPARKWLVRSSPTAVVDAVLFAPTLAELMASIPDAVRTGRRGGLHEVPHPPEWWRGYLRGLASVARLTVEEITRRVPLRRPRKLLDVAGGHGEFAAGFVRRHPGLRATVLDLSPACHVGRELMAERSMAGEVAFLEGDLRTVAWPADNDVVLLFNILHNLEKGEVAHTLRRAHDALAPGGRLIILDGEHAGGTGDLGAAEGFGELFFFAISNSNTWPVAQLEAWAREAGFSAVRRLRLLSFPSSILLVCTRP